MTESAWATSDPRPPSGVRLGTAIFADMPAGDALAWGEEVDAAGFEWLGIPDSPLLIREVYILCAALAVRTSRIPFAPMVTNPVSRHPSVTASHLLTLHELAPGRVSLGIGTGDSALYGAGMRGAPVALLREYILVVKGLLRGEEVGWQDHRFRAMWRGWEPPLEIKVYVSCHGPKVMRMAGEVADGVISGHGLLPENIQFVKEQVAEGARAAGRSPAEIEIWWHPFATLAPSVEQDLFNGFTSHFLTRFTMDDKQIPDEYRQTIRLMAEQADRPEVHGRVNPELTRRAKDIGLLDYLSKREGGFVGPPSAWVERVEELRRHGADRLILAPLGPDGRRMARRMAQALLAAPS